MGIIKVLVVEYSPEIVESVSLAFQIGWPEAQLIHANTGRKAIELAHSEGPDVIVLDLDLPDMSGFEVLGQLRCFSSVPVIVLTARAEEDDIIRALEQGADDYIVKPCGHTELLIRVRARIHDYARFFQEPTHSFDLLSFNPSRHQLRFGSHEIILPPVEGHIIYTLIKRQGLIATYPSLVQDIWEDDFPGSEDSLKIHVRRLAEMLRLIPGAPQLIFNRPGIGYCLSKLE